MNVNNQENNQETVPSVSDSDTIYNDIVDDVGNVINSEPDASFTDPTATDPQTNNADSTVSSGNASDSIIDGTNGSNTVVSETGEST